MKRLPLSIGLLGALVFAAFFRFSTVLKMPEGKSVRFALASKESPEDPVARAHQEWMQLRDPKTNQIPSGIRSRELSFAKMLPNAESLIRSGLRKGEVLTWTSRGPFNQGGRTRGLAYDISDATGNTILAGGVSGGMWRSIDGGTSWTRRTSLADSVQSVSCLVQDPRVGFRNIWYYGTGEFLGNSARGGGPDAYYIGDGVYKSTDGGVSWQKLTKTASWTPQVFDKVSDFVWNVVVDPTNGNVYAALYGEIIRSTDGGTTWGASLAPTSAFSAYTDIAVTSGGVFYAVMSSDGSDGGVYRSTTGASGSWINITSASWPATYNRTVLGIAPSNQNLLYFLSETPGSGYHDATSGDYTSFWKYTYVSGDGSGAGGTWVDRSTNLPNIGGSVGNFSHQGGYDLIVKVKPDNPNFVFIGGTNLYRSSDGFATTGNTAWIGGYATVNNVSQYAGQHPDQHSMAFYPNNSAILLSGSDGGISKTTNDSVTNVAWSFLNNGYQTSQFYSLAIDQSTSGDPVIIGGMQDNGHMFTNTTNASTPWVVLPAGGDGGFTAIASGKTSYYICTQNGDALRLLLDVNGNFTNFAGVKPSGATGFMFTTPYVLDPNNTNMMYLAAGNEIWRNSDLTAVPLGSQSATAVNWAGLTNSIVSGISGSAITAVAVSTTPANRLYFGTDSSKVFRMNAANTGSPSATNITGGGFPADAYVSCIAVNPRNADTAIVVFSNYGVLSLFFTANGGTNWSNIGGNLEENTTTGAGRGPSCRWATILPTKTGVQVYVATSTGVYSTSSLNGTSTVWALEGAGVIGNVVSTMVVSRVSDGLVAVSTHGNGIFSAQAITSVQTEAAPLPQTFALAQNFPNPFNPSTNVQYVVPRTGTVKLAIFDVTGRHIATLAEGIKAAGTYSAVWDGKADNGVSAASGVYFYRLEAAGFSATRKMVLMK